MGAYVYFSSLREFLRARRLWAWIILALAGMLLAIAWPHLHEQATRDEQYTVVTSMLTFHVLALASAIFSTAVVTQEVEQKTIVYLLTRPVPRWTLLVGRYLASATVVSLLGILGALLVSAGTYHAGLLSNPILWRDVLAIVFGAFAYGALFLFVSLLINRAMIVCLLFAFGWESIVPYMPGEMYRLSIYSHMLAIADHPSDPSGNSVVGFATGSLATNAITSGSATTTLLVLTAVLVAVGALWFTRSEYVPREDAE